MHKVFTNRWAVFHAPVTTVNFNLHPEFRRHDTDKGTDVDLDKVITYLDRDSGAPPATLMKFQYEEMRIVCQAGSHNLHSDMNDREPGAFHGDYMKSDMHVWIKTFFKSWSALMWLVLKVVLLSCSASAWEHNWSIEGWIHSNRRNKLGQKFVECLVCTHTNLKLEQRLEMYETGLLPWDIEMTVEEPVSDDDDGSPHRVSDSESSGRVYYTRPEVFTETGRQWGQDYLSISDDNVLSFF
jgi:hypothetical protein